MNFKKKLNNAQIAAVCMTDNPLCILAGAGSGKTMVIIHKIAYLIKELRVDPQKILGVTFTNKSAQEMRNRVENLLPGYGKHITLGTFHSIAAKLLRIYGYFICISSNFIIYNESDSKKLLNLIIKKLNIESSKIKSIYHQINIWQNQGKIFKDLNNEKSEVLAYMVYKKYEDILFNVGALDFNGLLFNLLKLICNKEAFKILNTKFRHILVDEYQDTNVIQASIIVKFAEYADTVTIVGDDDQSIYSWRGADSNNMKKFMNQIQNTCLIKLEKNYRSSKEILFAANSVIKNNKTRIGKKLKPTLGNMAPVKFIKAFTDKEEAEILSILIKDRIKKGISANKIAVLMRTNSLSYLFEDAFQKFSIPYHLIGDIKFYDRKEIKDILSVLRVALNKKSEIDLISALVAVPRGIGQFSIKKAKKLAENNNLLLFDVLCSDKLMFTAKILFYIRKKICNFMKHLVDLSNKILHISADEAVKKAITISGIKELIKQKENSQNSTQLKNINQLINVSSNFVKNSNNIKKSNSIFSFLEEISLLINVENKASNLEHEDSVSIMTLHAAKGLEFDVVFIVAMEEGFLPYIRVSNLSKLSLLELEEERRLLYVGITRAKNELFLTYAKNRIIHGLSCSRQVSRFFYELCGSIIDYRLMESQDKKTINLNKLNVNFKLKSNNISVIENVKKIAVGDKVYHKLYGDGFVIKSQRDNGKTKNTVCFNENMINRIIYAEYLKKIF